MNVFRTFQKFVAEVTQYNDYVEPENNEYAGLNPESRDNIAESGMIQLVFGKV